MSGWIKLHRHLIDWEWYTDHNTCRLFIHCLIRANHAESKWRGQTLNRGQFLTSLDTLSKETGLSVSQIRTALKKLESTSEIASLSQARSRIITVLNYDLYQAVDKLNSRVVASSSQADDKLIATDKNVKKNKNVKNDKKMIIVIPDGINITAWEEWINYRKSKKKPVSQAAANKQFKLLSNHGFNIQRDIIDQSIINDYQGLFEPRNSNGNNQSANGQHTGAPKQSLIDRSRDQAKRSLDIISAENASHCDVAQDDSII